MTFWRRSAGFGRPPPGSVPVADLLLSSLRQNSARTRTHAHAEHQLRRTEEDYSFGEESNAEYPGASAGAVVQKKIAHAHAHAEDHGHLHDDSFVASSVRDWEDDLALKYAKANARVEHILNRCWYLYSKRGLDLRSLNQELQLEEAACKAPLKEFRDKWYEISISKQKQAIYGDGGEEKDLLELPPICAPSPSRLPTASHTENRPKTRTALPAAAFMLPASAKERTPSVDTFDLPDQHRLNEEWLNSLESKSSMIADELFSLRPAEFVPPTAAKTFSNLLVSRFK